MARYAPGVPEGLALLIIRADVQHLDGPGYLPQAKPLSPAIPANRLVRPLIPIACCMREAIAAAAELV
jgi:hypothetical protein